jgi:hypothetical protein
MVWNGTTFDNFESAEMLARGRNRAGNPAIVLKVEGSFSRI